MVTPEACLSPAVCYHVYHLTGTALPPAARATRQRQVLPLRVEQHAGPAAAVGLHDARDRLPGRPGGAPRGTREGRSRRWRGSSTSTIWPARSAPRAIRSSSRPTRLAKTYFQLSSDTKYEVSLLLPEGARLAVGSLNYHTDFFGRAFEIAWSTAAPSTACASRSAWSGGCTRSWPSTATIPRAGRRWSGTVWGRRHDLARRLLRGDRGRSRGQPRRAGIHHDLPGGRPFFDLDLNGIFRTL